MQEREQGLSNFVRNFNQQIFLNAFSKFDGTVDLVWDSKKMMRQLNVIVTLKLLSECANVVKNFSLEVAGQSNAENLVFLLYPNQRSIELLLTSWMGKAKTRENTSYHIFFIPEESYTLRERLKEDQHIWSQISTVGSLPLHWFPCEQPRVTTMDLSQLPSQMFVNGDWNFLFKCAKALKQLVCQFNWCPNFHCKGEWSARIVDILRKLPEKVEEKQADTSSGFRDVTDIVLIDRWVDPLTPMLRQFSFGGACDDFFGIDFRGFICVPLEEIEEIEPGNESNVANERKELSLNDQIFERLQDLNTKNVAFEIRTIVDELKEEEQQRKSLGSVAEYKNFVTKLPNLVGKRKSTGLFMRLAGAVQRREADKFYMEILQCEEEILRNPQPEKTHPFIENSLVEAQDKNSILRLIILQCLTSKGLKPSVLQNYTKLFVQSYGISELNRLLKLQLAGLIRDENFADGRFEARYPLPNYIQLFKKHKMTLSELDEMRRSDGKPSLLVRMIEEGWQTNWNDFTTISVEGNERRISPKEISRASPSPGTVLIFAVGGITRVEISMLKQISPKIMCCTTAFLSANDLLNSFQE